MDEKKTADEYGFASIRLGDNCLCQHLRFYGRVVQESRL
jgi:hypothetical protein